MNPSQIFQEAVALHRAGRLTEAEALYRQLFEIEPRHFALLHLFGALRLQQGRSAEALELAERALQIEPGAVEPLAVHGCALRLLGRPWEALADFDLLLSQSPGHAPAHYQRGCVLTELERFEEALASFDKAVAIVPLYPEALFGQGAALHKLKRPQDAIASYDRALAVKPDYPEALYNRGDALEEIGLPQEAVASYDRALAARPDYIKALNNRAVALQTLKRFAEASETYEKILALEPDHVFAFGGLVHCALQNCDWTRWEERLAEMRDHVTGKKSVIPPGTLLGCYDDAALHQKGARTFLENLAPTAAAPLWNGTALPHARIRLAYLSADFHTHATAQLMAELFERHDRTRFELLGISFGGDDGSAMRARLVKAFDGFHDIRARSDEDAAKLLRDLEVDIAVDLKGYTQGARPLILAHRPAPIQVNYLGYPGTMAAGFIDYIIADGITLPFDRQPFFTERIVHLPGCYQPNDTKKKAAGPASRAEAGLPATGFVFCCFNNSWKITPPLFGVWMRLLRNVEGSVLWLIEDSAEATGNLRRHAAARGIDPDRLCFAPRVSLEEHLARHPLADLFLDTLPYNAHTTASDALWAGVPLVTCRGEAFAGRVAASLLEAVGLPELVTETLVQYEELASKLAADPHRLRSLRQKLAQNRSNAPLFDTERFARNLEAAYTMMWEIRQRGEAPQSFAVPPR